MSFQETRALRVSEMIASGVIDASPGALFHGHYNAANVSAEIVAIGQPSGATVALVVTT